MTGIEIDGLDGWIPLRTDLPVDELRADLEGRLTGQDPSAVPLLVSLVTNTMLHAGADAANLVAMWARYDDATQIVPVAIASLRLVGLAPETTPETYALGLATEWSVRGAIDLDPLETGSGPAHHMHAVLGTAERSAFEAQREDVVFWLRPESERAMLLSTNTVDLVRGPALGRDLAQLALGVRGF